MDSSHFGSAYGNIYHLQTILHKKRIFSNHFTLQFFSVQFIYFLTLILIQIYIRYKTRHIALESTDSPSKTTSKLPRPQQRQLSTYTDTRPNV